LAVPGKWLNGLKSLEMNIVVITCQHTGHKVLFDFAADICLHNDTVEQDEEEVLKFIEYTHKYLEYITDNGLDNDYNAISYDDLINFVENHIEA
jgi:hypothetical protein